MVNRNRWNKSTERLPAKSEIRVVSVMWGNTGLGLFVKDVRTKLQKIDPPSPHVRND